MLASLGRDVAFSLIQQGQRLIVPTLTGLPPAFLAVEISENSPS